MDSKIIPQQVEARVASARKLEVDDGGGGDVGFALSVATALAPETGLLQ